MKIKRVKYWLKLKRTNDLWIHLCSITNKVSVEEAIALTERMRKVVEESNENYIENLIERIEIHINRIKSSRDIVVNPEILKNEKVSLL